MKLFLVFALIMVMNLCPHPSWAEVPVSKRFSCLSVLLNEIPQPPMSYFPEEPGDVTPDFTIFPVSSEIQIGKIQHMIQRIPCGLYLTVGSERGFRAASMSDKITALYLLDVHDDIIRYNRINRELIKAASRHEYLYFRWESDFAAWQKLFEQMQSIYGHPIDISADDFRWWEHNVRELGREGYVLPEYLNRVQSSPLCTDPELSELERSLDLGQILDYKTGNYLFYDDLYERIHKLAIQNRIYTSKVNLLDEGQLIQLLSSLNSMGLTLSVLDFDNLYYKDYLGQEAYHRLIPRFLPLGEANSVLLVMSNYKDYACGQYQFYLGFTFENVETWSPDLRMEDFTEGVPKEVHDLIDGRLYEGGETLPEFGV